MYVGFAATDAGGPFRQSLTEIAQELMADFCPLFVQCQGEVDSTQPSKSICVSLCKCAFVHACVLACVRACAYTEEKVGNKSC